MNKKSMALIIAAVVIIVGAGAAFALTRGGDKDKSETTQSTQVSVSTVQEESSTSEASTSQPQTNETTTIAAEKSTSKAVQTTKTDYSFIKKGVWYYFDDTKHEAYAFNFKGDDDVDITYYSSDNVDGNDPQTASGEADYAIVNNEITIDDISSNLDANSFTFKIDGKKIKDDSGKSLENKDRDRLEYAFDHFNG